MSVAIVTLALVWVGLIVYVALGGADFGAGIWDLLASGPTARRQQQFISRVLGPVWEANHVWLIFLLVGLMNLFPVAYAALMSALFIPLMLALVGIVLRGAGFIFRTYTPQAQQGFTTRLWSRVFSLSSLLTPFFLGLAAATVADGHIPLGVVTTPELLTGWITPFSVAVGAMAVLQCATLAAVYLTTEAHARHEGDFARSYRLKALGASALVSALGLLCLELSATEAPWLWRGLQAHALAYAAATVLMGLLVLVTLSVRRYRLASLFVVLETALMLTTWGVSQYPYLIPPDLTIEQATTNATLTVTLLVVMILGLLVVLPSLAFLLAIFQWNPAASIARVQAERGKDEPTAT